MNKPLVFIGYTKVEAESFPSMFLTVQVYMPMSLQRRLFMSREPDGSTCWGSFVR